MVVDGRKISKDIKQELKEKLGSRNLVLAVVWVGDDPATAKFVELKRKFGEAVGVEVRVMEYDSGISEDELAAQIERLADDAGIQGIIVQLPLPKHINAGKILNLVPVKKDVDALNADASVLTPVVGAIKEIIERNSIDLNGKKIVIVGKGKLVGMPTAIWLAQEGYEVEMLDRKNSNLNGELGDADVIISGAGVPKLIKPEMIKSGAVIIDAGTSEDGGALVGDVDPACADKCSLFTPVPGGVGPITVAMIFKNLAELIK